jgi:hypothetical protein
MTCAANPSDTLPPGGYSGPSLERPYGPGGGPIDLLGHPVSPGVHASARMDTAPAVAPSRVYLDPDLVRALAA